MTLSAAPAASPEQAQRFYLGSIDYLVGGEPNAPVFYPIEMNGSAVIGASSLPFFALNAITDEFTRLGERLSQKSAPLMMIPFSRGGNAKTPIKALHERILYAQAVKQGFLNQSCAGRIVTSAELLSEGWKSPETPTVVLGYIHDLLPLIAAQPDRLDLNQRRLDAMTHDQFCDILFQQAPASFRNCLSYEPINRIFQASSDKTLFFDWYNQFISARPSPFLSGPLWARACDSEESLIQCISEALESGRRVVIKPRASALGRGIEFFLSKTSPQDVTQRVQASIAACQNIYGPQTTCFPYGVFEFIDAAVIQPGSVAGHASPFEGHKFELRIFIWRSGQTFYAAPSIAKIASAAYDAQRPDRFSLLNNIAAAKTSADESPLQFALPLANAQTLALLGLPPQSVLDLCQFSTRLLQLMTQEDPITSCRLPL